MRFSIPQCQNERYHFVWKHTAGHYHCHFESMIDVSEQTFKPSMTVSILLSLQKWDSAHDRNQFFYCEWWYMRKPSEIIWIGLRIASRAQIMNFDTRHKLHFCWTRLPSSEQYVNTFVFTFPIVFQELTLFLLLQIDRSWNIFDKSGTHELLLSEI